MNKLRHFHRRSMPGILCLILMTSGCAGEYSIRENVERAGTSFLPTAETIDGIRVEYLYIPPSVPDAPVCVAFHGNAGGWDQGFDMATALMPDGCGVLSPSRFGYLGSELPQASTPERQARIFSTLMDRLSIEKAFIVGGSAGSLPALRFALLYPERIVGLIIMAGAAPAPGDSRPEGGPPQFFIGDFWWGLTRSLFPGFFRSMLGISDKVWQASTEEDRSSFERMIGAMFPIEPRRRGILNDMNVTVNDAAGRYEYYGVEALRSPVLLLHAEDDPFTPAAKVRDMSERIPVCRLVMIPDGGHVMLGHERELRTEVARFIRETEYGRKTDRNY